MTEMTRIPTRSRRQAMDWSLALISQGIESTIEHSEDTGWSLTVATGQHMHAEETIRRYQAENRPWPWLQNIREEVLFDWASLAWVILMALFYWLQTSQPGLRTAGLMNSAAVSNGEWWRLFTATCLHADLAHLAMNISIGLFLLGLTMGRFGTGVGLLAAFLAGAGGNVATWLMFPEHRSLGASGMVMGCVGLLTAQAFTLKRHPTGLKYAVTGLAAGALLFVLLGFSPGTDVLAHFGGFVAGIILGCMLLLMRRVWLNASANVIAGLLFALLMVGSWWQALRHS
jgi:rhomboid protease GluP